MENTQSKLDRAYADLICACNTLINGVRCDGLEPEELEIDRAIGEIEKIQRDPWLYIAQQLKELPKIIITQEQKDFLNNLGVNTWTNGAEEVFVFNTHMTFIPVVAAPNDERSVATDAK